MKNAALSFWLLPLLSAIIWLAMLLAMLIHWLAAGKPHYPSMQREQTIAYISNVGAASFKPLFIAMGTVSVIVFDMGFIAERWLRHRGVLVHNTSSAQKWLAAFSILFAVAGAAGFILLSIFDAWRHHNLHDAFLGVFIGGYVISACFTCAEYQRLGVHFQDFKILRISFWMKLFFIVVEVALAIAFGALNRTKHWNSAAVTEWVIALIYSVWVLSFVIDFLPAARASHYHTDAPNMEEAAIVSSENMEQTGRNDGFARQHDTEAGMHYPSGTTTNGEVGNGWHANGLKDRQPESMLR